MEGSYYKSVIIFNNYQIMMTYFGKKVRCYYSILYLYKLSNYGGCTYNATQIRIEFFKIIANL